MLTLATLALAQAVPQPGRMKTFGDWAVACDNVKRCEMTSLYPEEGAMDGEGPQLSIVREPGPGGGWTVETDTGPDIAGVRLRVEGALAPHATTSWSGQRFTGGEAAAIVAAIVHGKMAMLSYPDGKSLGRVSLTGSSAALRFIDAEQGRAGTVTAAVAKGSRPAGGVPVAPPLPVITAQRPTGAPASLPAALIDRLWVESECAENYESDARPQVERHALGGGATLVLIPCGAGAYNYSSVPYVVAGGKAVLAAFDAVPGWGGEGGPPMLVNAGFDARTGELSSYAKGRGIGDCGSAETYVWDGTRFRLIEARAMGECRGSINWLTVWRAKAVPR